MSDDDGEADDRHGRCAVRRGVPGLRDEDAIFARELDAARNAALRGRGMVRDWYAFTLSFKGVVLEGLEVVFIVLTFGANAHDVPLAALAAVVAALLVIAPAVALYALALVAILRRNPPKATAEPALQTVEH